MILPTDTQQRTDSRLVWGVCGFLLLAVGLIYGQTLGHDLLHYDDNGFVFENPYVTAGLTGESIRWAFTDGPYGEWYPLAPLSHMLDVQLFGLNAWGHHLTSVLLHAAASIALLLVLWRMTGELWPSSFVATIFAVHPQHVESVAWVAERRDVLSGLLFMLTLGAYLGYVRRGRPVGRYLLTAALFTLGLLAKPMLVTVPPLLMLLDFWPLARCGAARDTPAWAQSAERPGTMRLVLEKLPLFALTAGECLMTLRTHVHGEPLSWSMRIGHAAIACVTYVVQLFYPVDLAVFYPYPTDSLPTWKVAASLAILGIVSAAVVIWRRRCPYLFVGWFWYLGMLVPVLGLVRVADHTMADRYMYLPGIGLSIALTWGATRLLASSPGGRWGLATCAGLVIAALVALAARQTSFWRDDETLWRHAMACTTDNDKAETGVADALARQGRREEAIAFYRLAGQHATDATPFINLGTALIGTGQFDEAIVQFRHVLDLAPDSFEAHANLGLALAGQGRLDESMQHLRRALEINPAGVNARCSLAHVLLMEGKIDEAIVEFERAVALDPHNPAAQRDLAETLLSNGQIAESLRHFEASLAIDPQAPSTHIGLAHALAAQGQIGQAVEHYRQALQLDPNNPAAREELGKLLETSAPPPAR